MPPAATVRLDLQSRLDMLDFVQTVSEHLARRVGLDADSVYWVAIAVRESVVNAIKHGNENDAGKRVHVEFTPLEHDEVPGLSIRVRDEGAGFDPDVLADCLASENLLKTCGRGIFMIRSFMDELVLQRAAEGGMEVRMIKRVQHQKA